MAPASLQHQSYSNSWAAAESGHDLRFWHERASAEHFFGVRYCGKNGRRAVLDLIDLIVAVTRHLHNAIYCAICDGIPADVFSIGIVDDERAKIRCACGYGLREFRTALSRPRRQVRLGWVSGNAAPKAATSQANRSSHSRSNSEFHQFAEPARPRLPLVPRSSMRRDAVSQVPRSAR